MTEYEKILSTEYSDKFDKLRKDMMVTSYYKYGPLKTNSTEKLTNIIASLEKRLKAYKDTGNTEFLADIANFAMIEFMHPQHPTTYYKATDSNESPGIVGMSTNEIKRFKEGL